MIEEKVKARPILFCGPMIRALLDGRKTQTRRLVKAPPLSPNANSPIREVVPSLLANRGDLWDVRYDGDNPKAIRCPYGKPGDHLWVRETFCFPSGLDPKSPAKVAASCLDADYSRPWSPTRYEADGATVNRSSLDDFGGGWGKTRVSIHMPRWASRITLEVTEIRVQRVHSISEDDAFAEGVGPGFVPNSLGSTSCVGYRPMFARVWSEINGKGSWDLNPWVWAISFRRLEVTP